MAREFSLIGVVTLAIATATPAHSAPQRLSCTFRGETDECPATGICVNDPRVVIGNPPPSLTLDFSKGTAVLYGVKGVLSGDPLRGKAVVQWEPHIFGTQQVILQEDSTSIVMPGVNVMLKGAESEAGFKCVPAD